MPVKAEPRYQGKWKGDTVSGDINPIILRENQRGGAGTDFSFCRILPVS